MADNTTQIVDTLGNVQDVPSEDAPGLLQAGATQPSAEQLQQHQNEELNSSPLENIKGAAEGAASTLSLGNSTGLEKSLLGVKDEDINRRRGTVGHTIGTIAAIPALGAVTAGAGLPEGAAAAAAEMALAQSGEEASKYLSNDPQQTVANAAMHVGMSGLVGGAFGAAQQGLKSAAEQAADSAAGQVVSGFKSRLMQHLSGAATGNSEDQGGKLADYLVKKGAAKISGEALGGGIGGVLGGMAGHPGLGAMFGERLLSPLINSVLPTLVKPVLSAGEDGAAFRGAGMLGAAAVKGGDLLSKVADATIKGSANNVIQSVQPDQSKLDKLKDWVDAGNDSVLDPITQYSHIAHYLPDAASAIGQKMGEVNSYLQSQKPKVVQNSPFDTEVKPTQQQESAYNRTLQIAEQPLSIAQRIKDGTLTSKDVVDLNSMHPEVHQALSQAMLTSVIEHKASGGVLPYKMQQSLSILAGQPLNSTMHPQSIMAAQAVFQPQQQPPQAQSKAKGKKAGTALSKTSELAQTPAQARQADRQSND